MKTLTIILIHFSIISSAFAQDPTPEELKKMDDSDIWLRKTQGPKKIDFTKDPFGYIDQKIAELTPPPRPSVHPDKEVKRSPEEILAEMKTKIKMKMPDSKFVQNEIQIGKSFILKKILKDLDDPTRKMLALAYKHENKIVFLSALSDVMNYTQKNYDTIKNNLMELKEEKEYKKLWNRLEKTTDDVFLNRYRIGQSRMLRVLMVGLKSFEALEINVKKRKKNNQRVPKSTGKILTLMDMTVDVLSKAMSIPYDILQKTFEMTHLDQHLPVTNNHLKRMKEDLRETKENPIDNITTLKKASLEAIPLAVGLIYYPELLISAEVIRKTKDILKSHHGKGARQKLKKLAFGEQDKTDIQKVKDNLRPITGEEKTFFKWFKENLPKFPPTQSI